MKDGRSKRLSVREAKEMDLADYLEGLDIRPDARKSRGQNLWYLSPFREENTPSFRVNTTRNRWRDFGEFSGIDRGNIVDFGVRYFKCTVTEFLARLSDDSSFQQQAITREPRRRQQEPENKITIISERPLNSLVLLDYLSRRGISPALAKAWCLEVDYQIKNGIYKAIGFKNNSGGFELRNERYKLSSSPKDLTVIGTEKATTVHVFEGFTDFLSYLSLPGSRATEPAAYVVLNSLSFFQAARQVLEQYICIKLYLDQDKSGIACTQLALSLSKQYQDESKLYTGHKDLNEYLVNLKQLPKQQIRQKPK